MRLPTRAAADSVEVEQRRENARQKRLLDISQADVVLTTYQVLRREVHYAGDFGERCGRVLRHAKRYAVPTCPLLACGWWRVVLDEAQMVEGTTTATATMALRLRARHRWCVTGTPIGGRGVEDLHGLLLFLRSEPFATLFWWRRVLLAAINDPSPAVQQHGLTLLTNAIQPIMWRSSKARVQSELGIPPMTEVRIAQSVAVHSYMAHFLNIYFGFCTASCEIRTVHWRTRNIPAYRTTSTEWS